MQKTIFRDEYRKLIDQIIYERMKKGITQRVLADKVGVYSSVIAQIELYNRRLDVVEMITILKTLEVSKKDILKMVEKLVDAVE